MKVPRWGSVLIAAAAWLEVSPSPAAEATSLELKQCAAIANSESRLACYDALSGRSANGAASSPAPAAALPAVSASAPAIPAAAPAVPALAPAIPAAAPAARAPAVAAMAVPAPAPMSAPVAPADPAEAVNNFGLSSAQLHNAPQGPPSIEARVSQITTDRALRSFVVLDNGQTWISTDGGLQLDSGELVTIKRAALGSFMLVSTTSKHSYHVHRVR